MSAAASMSVARVLSGQDGIKAWQADTYRSLHRHPELPHQETRTAAMVAETLRDAGYDVQDGIGTTGVVGILRHGDGPTVLMRADMDGLPMREETGLEYASTDRQTDLAGQDVPVAHACGHDVHIVSLLGAARLLADARDAWQGTFVALFQPAEELGTGAQAMVDDGLVQRIPRPDVALAQHVLAYPSGTVATREISAAIFTALSAEGGAGWLPGVISFAGRQDNVAIREAALLAFGANFLLIVAAIVSIVVFVPKGKGRADVPASTSAEPGTAAGVRSAT